MAKQATTKPREATQAGGRGGRGRRLPFGGAGGTRERTSPFLFVQESVAELRKVTWPTRQETMNLTMAVVAMTLGISAFLGVIDSALDWVVKPILGAK